MTNLMKNKIVHAMLAIIFALAAVWGIDTGINYEAPKTSVVAPSVSSPGADAGSVDAAAEATPATATTAQNTCWPVSATALQFNGRTMLIELGNATQAQHNGYLAMLQQKIRAGHEF